MTNNFGGKSQSYKSYKSQFKLNKYKNKKLTGVATVSEGVWED